MFDMQDPASLTNPSPPFSTTFLRKLAVVPDCFLQVRWRGGRKEKELATRNRALMS